MYLVDAAEMRNIDRYTIDRTGIPALSLMENAGREIAGEALRLAAGASWLILVGKGNNGGDGIVCARHLVERGCQVLLVYAIEPERLTGEAALQRDIAVRLGIAGVTYRPGVLDWSRYDGIVDALLGTGSSGAPREPYASLIREANASGLPVVAADIPSGLDADTGETADPCIRADVTVALAFMKRGLLLYPGAETAGDIVVRPIGIPVSAARDMGVATYVLNGETLQDRFGLDVSLRRKADTHKGTYGHALAVAGSAPMSGAGLLCAEAALRAGCGLVTWALPERLALPLAGRLPEAMLRGMADGGRGDWSEVAAESVVAGAEGKQAIVLGPGMGRWPGDSHWLRELWDRIAAPVVIDADALNMLADCGRGGTDGSSANSSGSVVDESGIADCGSDQSIPPFDRWPKRKAAAVLTPHPGEMARLCGTSVAQVQRDRIGLARTYATHHGVTLVLKGARTVVATPHGDVYVNTTGNPGMATGGSGDVLAGMIAGLLAQGMEADAATALGVFLHGTAGDRAAAARARPGSMIAGDILDYL